MRWPRRLAAAVAVLTATALVVATALVATAPSMARVGLLTLAVVLAGTPTVMGLLVTRRRPGHVIGPLLTVPGLVAALGLAGELAGPAAPPGNAYFVAASQGAWVLVFVPVAVLLLFFPDGRLTGSGGRLTGSGGRWLLAALLVDSVTFMVVAATAPWPYLPPNESSPHVFGTLPHHWADALSAVTLPGLLVTLLLCVATLVRRFRRSEGRWRTQMKWLALAGTLLPLTLLATWAGYLLFGNGNVPLIVGLTLTYVAVPTAITIAIVRPDLYEVDRLIASTVTHTALTAALLTVFTAANLAGGLLVAGDSTVAAVAATSLCALVLAPLRKRVQRRADRWLYPARQAAITAVEQLRHSTVTVQARPEQLEAVLREALGDPQLRVGLLTPGVPGIVDVDAVPVKAGPTTVPVRLGGEQIGVLSASAGISRELLREIAVSAAPLVELVRLRAELRRALVEVEQSRARLLRVSYEERTRLERDLHDGAQQRLVSLGMALRLAQRRLPRGSVDVHGLLDEAVAELGTAVGELRQVAHGIRPSCLDDGLVAALALLVDSVPIAVDLAVTATDLAGDLETTAYYIASEAITNAVKHSCAQRITLHVDTHDSYLHVRIVDDGVGGAASRGGSGLVGLADRVAAHGGTLRVTSPQGGGTTVEAILPCAS